MARLKQAVQELIKAPAPAESITRARMDLEHALIATGTKVLQARAVVIAIDKLILERCLQAQERLK